MKPLTQASFTVGNCLVEPRLGIISSHGSSTHVEPKVMEVLVCLARAAGEVVSKEELIRTVWADTFVTEHVLKVAVSELRKALRDDAREPRFIQTIPKQGYRLIPTVSFEKHEAASTSKRKILLIASSVAVLLIIALIIAWKTGRNRSSAEPGSKPIRSIAVLPLEDLSPDSKEEYFAEGMTEAIISDLARTAPIRVISRTSSMRFKNTAKAIPEIAAELGVDAVIEGSVLRSGNRVRIIAKLIDGASDQTLWTQSYEREMGDLLALQSDLSADIARQIKLELNKPSAPVRLSAEAYEAYLKGRFFWNKRDKDSLLKSVAYFQQAIGLEPLYAPAHTGLADAYNYLGVFGHAPQQDVYPRARQSALKAIEIDPRLSDAHAALGFNLMYADWDWQAALEELERAIARDPARAINHHWAASLYSLLLRHDAAISAAREAQRLDPLSYNVNGDLGWYYYYARRFDEAIVQCRRTLELEPSAPSMRICMELCYQIKGQPAEAFAEMEEELKQSQAPESALGAYRRAYAKSGLRGVWELRIQNLERDASRKGRAYQMTAGYALMGNRDRAIRWLERAVADREGWVGFIRVDPAFDSLRQDGRFQSIVNRIGLVR
ncbi:MAG: winged helix-turn-helix domain-containing protein [Acidobacteriota bacterium]